MLKLARLYSLVFLADIDLGFLEFPGEWMLTYVSSDEQETPTRVLESCFIESLKLKIPESARDDFLIQTYDVDDGNATRFALRFADLLHIDVRTKTGKDFRFDIEQERDASVVKKQRPTFDDLEDIQVLDEERIDDPRKRSIGEACVHHSAVLHLLIKKQVSIHSEAVNSVLEWSAVAPNAVCNVRLEPIIFRPTFGLALEIEDMIMSTRDGLTSRNRPTRAENCSAGVYFMPDSSGERFVSVFKPTDEESCAPNNPFEKIAMPSGSGIPPEAGAMREVAAYLLDHPRSGHRSVCSDLIGFAGVPPTAMVECFHDGFNSDGAMVWKRGSLQMFIENACGSHEMNSSSLSTDEVHRISLLDIRFANLDRHEGNMLARQKMNGEVHLIPIDHEASEECLFDWTYWPQAKEPYASEIEEYVKNLDADQDIDYLKSYGWDMGQEFAKTFRICTMLLKKGVEKGLTAFEIGNLMMNPDPSSEEDSLAEMVLEAECLTQQEEAEDEFFQNLSFLMDFHLSQIAARKLLGRG
ncbi:PREDICTED: phosphatidylinositol 4-kinase gamma 4-like isoform X2 [Tarenaya hassleriana]|uniref:phosphatidylinositol 4-kinase gamma 4-like isoform X2 n=1 Tax=Tarenaya hassleriana TaxID=28532 RepID=UPI00053C483C|nr:PREDICTED: phosphatidylinositol 4-kinase gamma 4-like isoform X2 [Tarenaya hassleriana]